MLPGGRRDGTVPFITTCRSDDDATLHMGVYAGIRDQTASLEQPTTRARR